MKMNLENLRGINAVWLSETGLTNLNSGEGGSNYIDVKKYTKNDVEYPYVSGQAMRYYLKEAIRRSLEDDEYMCVPNEDGETCGEIENCLLCDLFGYMTTRKKESGRKGGAVTRVSPVKVAPAAGLMKFDENSNTDFLTRKHRTKEEGELEGDIVNVELNENVYKSGISIDIAKIGAVEEVEEARKVKITHKIDKSEKEKRIKKILRAIKNFSDYSKQARLLTDFTPDLVIFSLQNRYNHRLQKALELKDRKKEIYSDRLEEVLREVEDVSEEIIAGMISGTFENEEEIKKTLNGFVDEIKTPSEAVKTVIENI